jgi:hypothetical protein
VIQRTDNKIQHHQQGAQQDTKQDSATIKPQPGCHYKLFTIGNHRIEKIRIPKESPIQKNENVTGSV